MERFLIKNHFSNPMRDNMGTRWRNRLGLQVLKPGVLGSIPTEDEPLTITSKHYLIPEKQP